MRGSIVPANFHWHKEPEEFTAFFQMKCDVDIHKIFLYAYILSSESVWIGIHVSSFSTCSVLVLCSFFFFFVASHRQGDLVSTVASRHSHPRPSTHVCLLPKIMRQFGISQIFSVKEDTGSGSHLFGVSVA